MAIAAQEIILRRSALILTGRMPVADAAEMVLEKAEVFTESLARATLCARAGADPITVIAAALLPYSARTHTNLVALRQ